MPPGFPIPFGKYSLQRKLAKGGMAELFLATQQGTMQPVVIKRVLPHFTSDPEFLSMFLNEARIASQLAHPGIVRVFDLGQTEGHLYLAMEYIDGFDLETVVRAAGAPLPPELGARIVMAICDALYYANNMTDLSGRKLDVVHRDVTPGNVMITRQGAVKLVDFGIAKATAQLERTRPGIVKGKFRYMSPEQIEQRELDGRSDLFSLGVLLYEVTTGKRPFDRPQVLDIIRALTGYDPPPPAEVVPGYPRRISDAVVKALQKDRDRRFRSAREMMRALENAVADPERNQDAIRTFLRGLMRTNPAALGLDPDDVEDEPTANTSPDEGGEGQATAELTRDEVRKLLDAADRRAALRSPAPSARPGPPVASSSDSLFGDEEERTTLSPGPGDAGGAGGADDGPGDDEQTATGPALMAEHALPLAGAAASRPPPMPVRGDPASAVIGRPPPQPVRKPSPARSQPSIRASRRLAPPVENDWEPQGALGDDNPATQSVTGKTVDRHASLMVRQVRRRVGFRVIIVAIALLFAGVGVANWALDQMRAPEEHRAPPRDDVSRAMQPVEGEADAPAPGTRPESPKPAKGKKPTRSGAAAPTRAQAP